MTFGFSRDDAAKFLTAYYDNKIYESDPFQHLDQIGVGKLVKMAAHDGRETRPDLGLGICGERGVLPQCRSGLRQLLSLPCSHCPPGRRTGSHQVASRLICQRV